MDHGKSFKFSVIIPVYNVEDYLEETLLSVIQQTIGFEDSIQIVLVNDGSPDNSEEICIKYRDMYPENILYVKQENAGVSVARNNGLNYAAGKYINFLDSDDKWSEDAFQAVYDFFEEHYAEMDAAAGRIQFFDASTKSHTLNVRFLQGTRVADLTDSAELNSLVTQIGSTFFKAEAIDDVRFKTGLKLGEDALFATEVLMKRMKLGLISDVLFYYRRRKSETSAVQSLAQTRYCHIDRLEHYHLALIKLSEDKFGSVIPYVQNIVYYDFGWHLYHKVYDILEAEDYAYFKELCKDILSKVDDEIIINSVFHKPAIKIVTSLKLKYGESFSDRCYFNIENGSIDFNGIPLLRLPRNRFMLKIVLCEIKDDNLVIEGTIASWVLQLTREKLELWFQFGNERQKAVLETYCHEIQYTCLERFEKYSKFSCSFPIAPQMQDKSTIRFYPFLKCGEQECKLGMNYSKFVPNSSAFEPAHKFYGKYNLICRRTVIRIKKCGKKSRRKAILEAEKEGFRWLVERKHSDIARLRLQYFFNKATHRFKDKIWLISDRAENAGDNGEVFFKYVSAHKPEGVRPIFAISKNAACVDRLKKEGEVVFLEDKKYLMYFLFADKIISSSAGEYTINPFGKDRKFLVDLFNFKFYYLQHGVACADLSSWLNKYSKNIYKLFTVSEREANGFLSADYYYTNKQIAITGQARFDDLYNAPEKMILVLPTWRRSIKESYDQNTTSVYFDGFKETDYFKYYNSLINDPRLLDVMRKHGYKGLFCMHPIHMKQTVDYTENDVFKINHGYVDYNDVFARAALTVTDYSSVLFDFAYLRKPVIYTQFDKEEFFAGQIYDEGYFSYENDGFGPVCYDYESTVNALISAIEKDCRNEDKYLERANNFFKFNDQNNSRRILEEIMRSEEIEKN